MRQKYPRTFHHPDSPGVQSDGKMAPHLSRFADADIGITGITAKMYVEKTTPYCDGLHTRSPDTGYHLSRDWLAGLHAQISYLIPYRWRACGEHLCAHHSVPYDTPASFCPGFSIWTDTNKYLSCPDTASSFQKTGASSVPVLYTGCYAHDLGHRLTPVRVKGLVVRRAASLGFDRFQIPVLKWVHTGQAQSGTYWTKVPPIPNGPVPTRNVQ